MTTDKIKRAGELLNRGYSGPVVAGKLDVSTASIYAFWKHVGQKKFVRKRPSDRGKIRAGRPRQPELA